LVLTVELRSDPGDEIVHLTTQTACLHREGDEDHKQEHDTGSTGSDYDQSAGKRLHDTRDDTRYP
jgi:hypothetical protein